MQRFPFASIPFEIVGFDLDRTLCDTSANLGAVANYALTLAIRGPVPTAKVRVLIGHFGELVGALEGL